MKLIDAKPDSFITRDYDLKSNKTLAIYIPKRSCENLVYYVNGTPERSLRKNSIAYLNNDFVYCDRYANPIKSKDIIMHTKNAKVIVTTSTDSMNSFVSEEDALLWITEIWQKAPNTKFTMFKPYQTVEPEVPDLKRFIKAIS